MSGVLAMATVTGVIATRVEVRLPPSMSSRSPRMGPGPATTTASHAAQAQRDAMATTGIAAAESRLCKIGDNSGHAAPSPRQIVSGGGSCRLSPTAAQCTAALARSPRGVDRDELDCAVVRWLATTAGCPPRCAPCDSAYCWHDQTSFGLSLVKYMKSERCVEFGVRFGFLCRDHTDLDEIEWADESVGYPHAASSCDSIA